MSSGMRVSAQYSCFLIVFSAVLLVQLSSYEWKGHSLTGFAGYAGNQSTLYGSLGRGSSSHTSRMYNPWSTNFSGHYRPAQKSGLIPPSFIRGAQVYDAKSFYKSPISVKPKRWVQAVSQQPAPAYPEESDSEEETSDSESDGENEAEDTGYSYPSQPAHPMNEQTQGYLQHTYDMPESASYSDPVYPYYDQYGEPEDYYPDSRIRQEYLAGTQGAPELFPYETDSYKVVMEKDYQEPARRVHRTAAPWPRRDIARLGSPRHEACNLPLERGVGPDDLSSWYYDKDEGQCRWFGYRGHGGNANRFYSRLACEAYCVNDLDDLCQAVRCPTAALSCSLIEDDQCKRKQEHQGRDWRLQCPPDQPVCLSRRGTRIAPNFSEKPIPPECFQSKDSGSCQKKNPTVAYHYDTERNACMTFYFHECGGNDNRFETKSECMTHCSP